MATCPDSPTKKNRPKSGEVVTISRTGGLIHQILFQRRAGVGNGDRLRGFLFTPLDADRERGEGEAGRFSTKCLICRGAESKQLKSI